MKRMFLPLLMLVTLIWGMATTTKMASTATVTAPATTTKNNVDPTAGSELDRKITDLLKKKSYSGTIIVVKNGQTVFLGSHGYANFANGTLNANNTAYEIDSVQKSMTAALIMYEVQKGKLRLTDTLSEFYPSIPGSEKITIRQLLDMTAGLVLKGDVGPNQVLSDESIINADIGNITYSNLLHGKWNYAPINYNLLSGILEQITGRSYRYLFQKHFIKKLHLRHTVFAYDETPGIQKASGYSNLDPLSARLDYRNAFVTKRFYEFDELGTGQVFMSVNDLLKVEQYIVSGPMLTEKSKKQLFQPGSVSTYGGGLYHGTDDNFANGWGYGYQAVAHLSNDGQTAVIALQNYQRIGADMKPVVKQIYQLVNE